MKKAICLIVAVLFIVPALAGCSSSEATTTTTPEETEEIEENEPEYFVVTLDANASTGYEWFCTLSEEGIVDIVSEDYVEADSDEGMVGGGGVYTCELEGVAEGDVTVTFTYSRSWEPSEDDETVVYDLHVDADGNITEN